MSDPSALAGRPVLVTGGAGFVGTHLVQRLLEAGASVTVLEHPAARLDRLAPAAARVRAVSADLAEPGAAGRALAGERFEAVFHLAAWTGGRNRPLDPDAWRRSLAVNVQGTLELLLALVAGGEPHPRVVRTGGMEEYGDGPVPFREAQRECAVTPYSASQVAATQFAHALAARTSLPLVTVRPALVYGPGQDESFFLPALVRACLDGREFEMTSGEQTVDYVHVRDVVEALALAAVRPGVAGEVFNAGSGREIAIRDLAERIAALTGAGATLKIGARAGRSGEGSRRFLDVARARERLGWTAAVPLEEGLRGLVAAMR